MKGALEQALGVVERLDAAKTPATVSHAFFNALAPFGARAFGARTYEGASSSGGSGIVFAQVLPPKWRASASARYVEELDPLPIAARKLARPVILWSEASPRGDSKWADYWSALSEHGLGEGIAVHLFAPNGRTSRVSIGLDRLALDASERRVIELSSYALLTRLQSLSSVPPAHAPSLSVRERDCLAWVARGLPDADIAERLVIAQSTVHFYIEKAKRKLGAKTRAQAVAHLITSGLF